MHKMQVESQAGEKRKGQIGTVKRDTGQDGTGGKLISLSFNFSLQLDGAIMHLSIMYNLSILTIGK